MWKCEICSREFKNKNQPHSCKTIHTIDAYIALFPPKDQTRLKELREIINTAAPEAEEIIRWKMPTFFQNKNLVHFAMHKNHIGFYVGPTAVEFFENELSNFDFFKGTIQFSNNKPLPYKLIKAIVHFKIEMHAK